MNETETNIRSPPLIRVMGRIENPDKFPRKSSSLIKMGSPIGKIGRPKRKYSCIPLED